MEGPTATTFELHVELFGAEDDRWAAALQHLLGDQWVAPALPVGVCRQWGFRHRNDAEHAAHLAHRLLEPHGHVFLIWLREPGERSRQLLSGSSTPRAPIPEAGRQRLPETVRTPMAVPHNVSTLSLSHRGEAGTVSTSSHDPHTGRPLADGHEAIGSLSDDELEAELTVTAYDPVRRSDHYDHLMGEWLARKRGYRQPHHRSTAN